MQQAQEADAEAEAQGRGGLRFVDQRGVVELKLVQRVAELRVVRAVQGIQAREHHRLGVLVAAERLLGTLVELGDRVTHLGLPDILHAGDQVAHLTDGQAVGRLHLRRVRADLQQLVSGAGRHHPDALALAERAVDDLHVGHDTAVGVVDRVEDHRAGGGVLDADRGRHLADDLVQQLGHADAGLGGDPQDVLGLAADQIGQLGGELLGLGGRQIDLVEDGDDRELVLHRQVEVGEGLGLDPLSGVDEEDAALARGERAGDLVGEVDVARGVDHVEDVGRATSLFTLGGVPGQTDRLGLDRDAALALDVHAVEVLRAHLPRVDDTGELEHPVGERRLAVVDVRDDAEVTEEGRIGTARLRHVRRGRGHAGSIQ